MTNDSSKTFLRLYGLMTVGALVLIVVTNAVIDPMMVYHKPFFPQRYVMDQREGSPGIARYSKYDGVVIGNSLTENFLDKHLRDILGWQAPLKLSIKGSTSREQRMILDQAIATGQVREVLWGVDFFAFERGPDSVHNEATFPFHMYKRDISTPFKYLLSHRTLTKGLGALAGIGAKTPEDRNLWHHKMKFNEDSVVTHWHSDVSKGSRRPPMDREAARLSFENRLLDVVKAHPEIHFRIVFAPYSALYRVAELTRPADAFAARLDFKRHVARNLIDLPNVEVFDFEVIDEITHDLNKYTDMTHFNLETSTAMLKWMAEGRYRIGRNDIERNIAELEDETYHFANAVFSDDSPLHAKLKIEQLGLKEPPRPPRRLAAEGNRTPPQ